MGVYVAVFKKHALTRDEHVEQLRNRGLVFEDAELHSVLSAVSYYRLSGYLFPFKTVNNNYATGTTLSEVWSIYTFDRQLRLLVLDAIERFEVAIRTDLFDRLALGTGPFGYLDPDSLPHLSAKDFSRLISSISRECGRSKAADFIHHFKKAYGDEHKFPPYWMIEELLSFGDMHLVYKGAARPIRRAVALQYGVREDVLESWLLSLNTVRNICAHHARLWNRVLGTTPKLPPASARPEWHEPVDISGARMFTLLSILRHAVSIAAPNSAWGSRLMALFEQYPGIRKGMMGFPDEWQNSPIWKP